MQNVAWALVTCAETTCHEDTQDLGHGPEMH